MELDWVGSVVWALVFLTLGLTAFRYLNAQVTEYLAIEARRQEIKAESRKVELLERENAARLATDTAEERASAEKASLHRKSAEDLAAAEIARSPETLAALAAQQTKVIDAQTEGMALAAKEAALRSGTGPSRVELLLEAYKNYRDSGGLKDLDDWLGSVSLDEPSS